VTLVVAVSGNDSIWLLADRRLSYRNRAPKDDARKIMLLETSDGIAILGYAGLGATALGMEPADWMNATLRGRNHILEHSLSIILEAAKRQLPRHLIQFPDDKSPPHHIMIPSFVNGEVRFYSIGIGLSPDKQLIGFNYKRHVSTRHGHAPRIVVGGSGAIYLHRDKRWARPLLKIIDAYDRGLVSSKVVADHLAKLNFSVHQNTADGTVGPRCIVAWRNKKNGTQKGGDGHRAYTNEKVDRDLPFLASNSCGLDVSALANAFGTHMIKRFKEREAGEPTQVNNEELNSMLSKLINTPPDDQLR
jgi:hypothetical protein